MRETVNIACSPLGEDCVQVSPASDYTPMMNKEVNAFKRMLERMTAAGSALVRVMTVALVKMPPLGVMTGAGTNVARP